MSPAALLEHIFGLPHARATFKQLIRELGAKGEERDGLEAALERLVRRGDLIQVRSGHYIVTSKSREFTVGRLNMHRDGYGFVIPDHPVEGIRGDIYIPKESAKQAMHGDRVVAHIRRIEADGRADGEIVKIVRRAHPTVVGEFRVRRRNYVVPHDERIRQWIEIPEGLEIPEHPVTPDRVGAKLVEALPLMVSVETVALVLVMPPR